METTLLTTGPAQAAGRADVLAAQFQAAVQFLLFFDRQAQAQVAPNVAIAQSKPGTAIMARRFA